MNDDQVRAAPEAGGNPVLSTFRIRVSTSAGEASESSYKAESADQALQMGLDDWAENHAVTTNVIPNGFGQLTAYAQPLPGRLFVRAWTIASVLVTIV